jgi:hypothetical protein
VCDERIVNIITAEPGIAIRGDDLEHTLVKLEDRNIERAPAQVVNGDLRFASQLVEAVGERCRGRFVYDALHGEARELARDFRGVALRVVEIRGYGDDCARNLPVHGAFGIRLQFFQNERGDLFR